MEEDFFDQAIVAGFIIESKEHLENVETDLVVLEKNTTDLQLLNSIFRAIHSIKGAASFLGMKNISKLTHRMENILDNLRKERLEVTSEIIDAILDGTDILIQMITEIEEVVAELPEDSSEVSSPDFDGKSQIEIDGMISQLEEIKPSNEPTSSPKESIPKQTPPTEEVTSSTETTTENISTTEKSSDSVKKASSSDQEKEEQTQSNANEPIKAAVTQATTQAMGIFLTELAEILENAVQGLLDLEKNNEDEETINNLFRAIHNCKGNARYLGLANTEKLSHHMENVLDDFRKGALKVDSEIIDLLFKCLDTLQEIMKSIAEKGTDESSAIDGLVKSLQEYSKGKPKSKQAEEQKSTTSDNDTTDIFLSAVQQHLNNIVSLVSKMTEKTTEDKDYDILFRACNGIKSSSNYMGYDQTKEISEAMEALAKKLQEEPARRNDVSKDSLSKCADYLKDNFASIKEDNKEQEVDILLLSDVMLAEKNPVSGSVAPYEEIPTVAEQTPSATPQEPKAEKKAVAEQTPSATPQEPKAEEKASAPESKKNASGEKNKKSFALDKTIRVDQTKLDSLMNLIGELIINRNRFSSITRSLEIANTLPDITKELKKATFMIKRISDDLQDSIMSARMIPVGIVFNKFSRMVRDLARTNKKNITLHISGEDTEIDKTIIEQIGDPLVHLIRNSADHGLESPDERKESGKDEMGNIYLRAFHEGNNIIIEVEDDGRGIYVDKIKQKALEKGVIDQEKFDTMPYEQALNLIFAAGFSTAAQVTNISGRGVGMDVVRNNITKLNGQITITTKEGQGSKITMILPLTLAIVDTVMVRTGDSVFAIPIHSVSETVKVKPEEIKYLNKRKSIKLRDKVIGLEDLHRAISVKSDSCLQKEIHADQDGLIPIIITTAGAHTVGFIVDELLNKQEIVIKPLVEFLSTIRGLSGSTILGDGSIILILDPTELIEISTEQQEI